MPSSLVARLHDEHFWNMNAWDRGMLGEGANQGGAAGGVQELLPQPCCQLHVCCTLWKEYSVGLGGLLSKHCPCSTLLSILVCILSSCGIDTNEGTLAILKIVAQYSVYL